MTDDRRSAPHVARNAAPIIEVLRGLLPERGLVLEVASGTGEHAVHFARAFPGLAFQPTDADPDALRSIDAWRFAEHLPNLLPSAKLNVITAEEWPVDRTDAVFCINMIHISPWAATEGLMRGAGRVLESGGLLYLYGPYRQSGVQTAPSNEEFDRSLKSRNPEWGLRHLDDIAAEAERHGLRLDSIVPMPANNLSVIFRKT